MQVKVCGINSLVNAEQLSKMKVNFIGLIFYKNSPRNFNNEEMTNFFLEQLVIPKVGVFVNSTVNYIIQTCFFYGIKYVQLHGDESPEFVEELSDYFYVIKAFSIGADFNFDQCKAYGKADYFLFDTKGKARGGNGTKFNWQQLNEYQQRIPFFLSGGIELKDAAAIKEIKHPQFYAIDINSGFELQPGIKDAGKIQEFLTQIV